MPEERETPGEDPGWWGYLVQIDHRLYRRRDGGTYTLPEALREAYGCKHAHVVRRRDETLVIRDAGRAYTPLRYEVTCQVIPDRTVIRLRFGDRVYRRTETLHSYNRKTGELD